MNHIRIALYDIKSGTAEEVAEIAHKGMLPIFKGLPGYVRYELGKLDSGGVVSYSIWESADQAQNADDAAASWVTENLAGRISLREDHVGDLFWDEA